jgi:hypothetical protein
MEGSCCGLIQSMILSQNLFRGIEESHGECKFVLRHLRTGIAYSGGQTGDGEPRSAVKVVRRLA